MSGKKPVRGQGQTTDGRVALFLLVGEFRDCLERKGGKGLTSDDAFAVWPVANDNSQEEEEWKL